MEKFTKLTAIAAPLPMINVDTDKIIPSRWLKTIKRTGLGIGLFEAMRFNDDGSEAPDFTLQAIDGSQVSLSSYRGKPVVLVFLRGFR